MPKYSGLVFVFIVGLMLGGCVAGMPHLSVDRGLAPVGTPVVGPTGIPVLSENIQSMNEGSVYSTSEFYQGYQGAKSQSGGIFRGNIYRMVGTKLGVGQQRLSSQE